MNKYLKLLLVIAAVFVVFCLQAKQNEASAYSCGRCSDTYIYTYASWEEDDAVCDRDGYEPVTYSCNCGCHDGGSVYSSSCYISCCNCGSFGGYTYSCGEVCSYYASSTVPYGSSCNQQNTTCSSTNDGTWSPTSPSGYSYCVTLAPTPASCYSSACGTVANGGTCTTYSDNSIPCGSSCSSYDRVSTCNNGTWSIAPYSYSSCSVQSCTCYSSACGTVSNGGTCTTYSSSSPTCGTACTSRVSTCVNGSWSVSPYSYSSCTASCCASGACSQTSAGGTCTTYPSSSPTCGTACSSTLHTCQSNGTWNTTPGAASTCTASCCASGACSQTSAGGTCTTYASSSPTCGTSCSSTLSTCQSNGAWNNTPGPASSCTAKCCASGACPQTNTGGTCTTYSSSAPSCGTACSSTLHTCQSNATWNSSPGPASSCTACCNNPWGGTTAGGGTITAYQESEVYCSATCSSEVRTCSATTGQFNGSYTNQNCSQLPCRSCDLPWGGTIGHGQSVTAYRYPGVMEPFTCTSTQRTCDDGTLEGDSTYVYESCSSLTGLCYFPMSGNATINSNCSLGPKSNVVEGVDAGTGIINTGEITIDNGATVTIGGADNQTLAYGQINLINGSIIIAKGVGAQLKKAPIWVQDADGDHKVPGGVIKQVDVEQPAGYTRRSAAHEDIPTDQAAYWKMNDDTSSVVDYAGTNKTGAIGGTVTPTAGKIGDSLSFDGSTGFVDTSYTQNLANAISWSVWVYVSSLSTSNHILSIGDTGTSGTGMNLFVNTSGNVVATGPSTSQQFKSTATLTSGQWYHVVLTKAVNGTGNAKLYINGVYSPGIAVAGTNETLLPTDSSSSLQIGRIKENSVYSYSGASKRIQQVRVFTKALSESEVASLYNFGPDSLALDCDDTNASKWQILRGYIDSDQDNYGVGSTKVEACSGSTLATGYSNVNTDCNDSSQYVFQNIGSTCLDTDQDGYCDTTTGTNCVGSSTSLAVESGGSKTFYKDSSNAYKYLTGQNGTNDCAAANDTQWANLTGYTDGDSDTYGTGTSQQVCSGLSLASGYANNNTDCDDSDANKWQEVSYYPDTDGDTYGDIGGSAPVCTNDEIPTGYSTTGTDCNDSNVLVYQSVSDLEIDSDHDGYINDGSQPTPSPTSSPSQCTGGTITTDGGYVIHTFTSSGTLECSSSHTAEVLVVAGGGGGGCGGGGGGGVLYDSSYSVTAGSHAVTVGAGGTGQQATGVGRTNGENSVFMTLTAIGGGYGAGSNNTVGNSGGSGGGAYSSSTGPGAGTSGQGYSGGTSSLGGLECSGGGGAGGLGGNCTSAGYGGNGGPGVTYSISGSSVCYAGGGGGGTNENTGGGDATCGGGSGRAVSQAPANGTANTGGGGGLYRAGWLGGTGGSGVVIIRYQP